MLEFLGLAAELVDDITSHFDKKALFNLCLTCSALRGIAQPYLFAQLTIHQREKELTLRKSRHSLYYPGGEDESEPLPVNPAHHIIPLVLFCRKRPDLALRVREVDIQITKPRQLRDQWL